MDAGNGRRGNARAAMTCGIRRTGAPNADEFSRISRGTNDNSAIAFAKARSNEPLAADCFIELRSIVREYTHHGQDARATFRLSDLRFRRPWGANGRQSLPLCCVRCKGA